MWTLDFGALRQMARTRSATGRMRESIREDQRRLAKGERPMYHVHWAEAAGGAIDVTISELPMVHIFVPDHASVMQGARILIASTLTADATSFDVTVSDS